MKTERVQLAHADLRSLIPLAGIVLLGLWLRMLNVGQQPLWTDEALTLVIRHWSAFNLLFRPVDPTAGLYYVLMKALPEAPSAIAARLPSVVFGTAAIATIYFASGKSLLAAAMFTLSPVLIDYSQEARAYSLLVFFVLISATGLIAWERSRSKAALTTFAGASVLAIYTHFTAAFWIAPAAMIGLQVADRKGLRREYLAVLIIMLVMAAPEVWRTLIHVKTIGTLGIVPQPTASDFLRVTSATLLPGCGWLLPVLLALSLWKARLNTTFAVALTLLSVPATVWLFSVVATPIFMPRSILLGIPGLILLLATSRLGSAVFIASALAHLAANGTIRPREDWRSVAAGIRPGETILVCPGWRAPALLHAMRSPAHVYLTTQRGIVYAGDGSESRLFDVLERPSRRVSLPRRKVRVIRYDCHDSVTGR